MRWLTRVNRIFNALFQRRRAETDLEAELAYHLEQETASNLRAGMTPQEAKFAAQRTVGPVALYKEECRDARGIGFVEVSMRDLRFAIRTLGRTPLFVATAVLTLALGIGANTTVFTFVENILMRPIAAADPDQLMSLNWGDGTNISYPNYVDFQDRNHSFSSMFAYRFMPINLSARMRDNARVWGYEASGNYFGTLGLQPLMGRFLGPADDDKWGAHPVMVDQPPSLERTLRRRPRGCWPERKGERLSVHSNRRGDAAVHRHRVGGDRRLLGSHVHGASVGSRKPEADGRNSGSRKTFG